MNSKKQQPLKSEKTLAEIFKYEVADGVSEYHLMIHAIQPESTYEEQLNAIIDTYYQLREKRTARDRRHFQTILFERRFQSGRYLVGTYC